MKYFTKIKYLLAFAIALFIGIFLGNTPVFSLKGFVIASIAGGIGAVATVYIIEKMQSKSKR